MKWVNVVCAALVAWGLGLVEAQAQVQDVRWNVGGFISYNAPLFSLGDRFSKDVNKWGVNVAYVPSQRATIEVEYHRSKLTNGILESHPVTWGVTGQAYAAQDVRPESRYEMTFNSLLMSGLIHLRRDRSMQEGSYSPYLAVGAGFYKHHAVAENIFWPAQSEPEARSAGGVDSDGNLWPAVVMFPQRDTRTALAASFGIGFETFLTSTIALDLRGRYHMLITELRPYDEWGLNKSFPLQMMDLSAGLKFYFWD